MAKTSLPIQWRKMGLVLAVAVFGAMAGVANAGGDTPTVPAAQITEQYTMLYYKDIAAARRFYGEILDLEATYNDDWVTLYQVLPVALLGVVQEG